MNFTINLNLEKCEIIENFPKTSKNISKTSRYKWKRHQITLKMWKIHNYQKSKETDHNSILGQKEHDAMSKFLILIKDF